MEEKIVEEEEKQEEEDDDKKGIGNWPGQYLWAKNDFDLIERLNTVEDQNEFDAIIKILRARQIVKELIKNDK